LGAETGWQDTASATTQVRSEMPLWRRLRRSA